jgi:hypothetical protein
MISTMLAACSSGDLVPPAAIDNGAQVGAIRPTRSLPQDPVSQSPYPMNSAPVSQASAADFGYHSGSGDAYTGDSGNYLRAPDQVQAQPLGSLAAGPHSAGPQSSISPSAGRSSRLPMIDSDEAIEQASRRNTPAATGVSEDGVNMDAELGFDPDESDVTGLAEEEAGDIAEGVSDQPVVDGIGTDAPRALQSRRQPVSDDRVIVPPKRQSSGLQSDLAGSRADWSNQAAAPGRAPAAATQQVAMLRPNNPTNNSAARSPMSEQGPMSEPEQPWLRSVMPQSEVSCRAELRRLNVEFQDKPRISNGPSCGIDYPVTLSGLSGNIDVKPAVTLNCQTTLAFAKWVKNELAPSARYRYLTGVGKIVPMGGYSCRRMNNSRQKYNPMSEHSRGNAIDIGRIVLKDGHEIDVRKKGLFSMREGGLLKAVRSDSCKYFSTVMGPGSNAEHWNHFHFDLRTRKGSRHYCN